MVSEDSDGDNNLKPKTSKELNEIFMQLVMPKMDRIFGKPQPKIDTGLDSHHHNFHIAEERRIKREKEI